MRILIVNRQLTEASGTVTYVRDLALALRGHHQIAVYAPQIGEVGHALQAKGIFVTPSLKRVPFTPNIIHGHHTTETTEAALMFKSAKALFMCHDRFSPNDVPPILSNIVRYVAVDKNCLERLEHPSIAPHEKKIIPNFVNLSKFTPRPALPKKPKRALLFCNYAKKRGSYAPIAQACKQHGIKLDVAGVNMGSYAKHPETLLPNYDLVFAKAKCAIEAMGVGCAVILYNDKGVGGMVHPKDFAHFRAFNFGMRLMTKPLSTATFIKEIANYDPNASQIVTAKIRTQNALTTIVSQLESLYEEMLTLPFTTRADEKVYLTNFHKQGYKRYFRKGVYAAFRYAPWLRAPLLAYRRYFT